MTATVVFTVRSRRSVRHLESRWILTSYVLYLLEDIDESACSRLQVTLPSPGCNSAENRTYPLRLPCVLFNFVVRCEALFCA